MADKGYIEVYTGDGKGKTTAAIGLAIRAIGAGHKVCIIQFMKSLAYSEQKVLQKLPNITLLTLGKPYFIAKEGMLTPEQIKAFGGNIRVYPAGHPPKEYKEMIEKGIDEAVKAVSGAYDLVILDEYNVACWYDLATDEDTERILKARKPQVELVFTGRNAAQKVLDAADLITEMKKIRHYFDRGVQGRVGIED
jgi:cob(I)alamin adenosyltransferase